MDLIFDWSKAASEACKAAAEEQAAQLVQTERCGELCERRPLRVGFAPLDAKDEVIVGSLRCHCERILSTFSVTRGRTTLFYVAHGACAACVAARETVRS